MTPSCLVGEVGFNGFENEFDAMEGALLLDLGTLSDGTVVCGILGVKFRNKTGKGRGRSF